MRVMKILAINAGSSSLRFKLFETNGGRNIKKIYEGMYDNHGREIKDFFGAVKNAAETIKKFGEISAVGHRVVHGGEKFTKPVKITPKVIEEIKKFNELAPLHNPPNLACILACQKLFPRAKQIAVFDTAFHQTMPEKAYLYGLPYELYKKFNIRRFGFHGTSHQYVYEQAVKKLGTAKTKRTVICHLGNGCSITAVKNGKVLDTSMGFSPLEGVPMGTRSGDSDLSIIFYLLKKGWPARKIKEMLNKKSGLLGVSEISSDVRDLWAAYRKKDGRAIRTMEFFAYRIAKYIGSYAAAMKGLDCVVFTGGIGENAFYLRKWIMNYIKFLKPKVLVIKTDEEKKIAEQTAKFL